jgi:CheY-like chemotaxis protein
MYACYLRLCGLTVQMADTTDEGLIRAASADVIVTGIRVNNSCDGLDLVRQLREQHETERIPVIVLTECALETDRRRAVAAGCDAFLPSRACRTNSTVRSRRS